MLISIACQQEVPVFPQFVLSDHLTYPGRLVFECAFPDTVSITMITTVVTTTEDASNWPNHHDVPHIDVSGGRQWHLDTSSFHPDFMTEHIMAPNFPNGEICLQGAFAHRAGEVISQRRFYLTLNHRQRWILSSTDGHSLYLDKGWLVPPETAALARPTAWDRLTSTEDEG